MHQCSSRVKAPVLQFNNETPALEAVRVRGTSTCEIYAVALRADLTQRESGQ